MQSTLPFHCDVQSQWIPTQFSIKRGNNLSKMIFFFFRFELLFFSSRSARWILFGVFDITSNRTKMNETRVGETRKEVYNDGVSCRIGKFKMLNFLANRYLCACCVTLVTAAQIYSFQVLEQLRLLSVHRQSTSSKHEFGKVEIFPGR